MRATLQLRSLQSTRASGAEVHGLSCPVVCGTFPDLCPGRAGPAGASTTPSGQCSAVSDLRSGQLHAVRPKPSPVRVYMGRLRPGLVTSGVGCGDPARGTRWEDLRKREPAGVQVGGHRSRSCVWFPRPQRLKKKMRLGRAVSRILFGMK